MQDDAKPTAAADMPAELDANDEAVNPRVERIDQYIAAALNLNEPLQACLGAACGDLMLIQYEMCQAVQEAFEDLKHSALTLTEIVPAVNTVTKVSQQVEHYQHTLSKLRAAQTDT
jgi:hypothetical protein